MTEHELTDEEVIEALECCANADCLNCPRWTEEWSSGMCADFLPSVLDLVNRQREELDDLREIVYTDRSEAIKKIQSDAIKEFLTTVLEKKDIAWHFAPPHEVVPVSVLECFAREFTEGKNDV